MNQTTLYLKRPRDKLYEKWTGSDILSILRQVAAASEYELPNQWEVGPYERLVALRVWWDKTKGIARTTRLWTVEVSGVVSDRISSD